MLLHIFQLLIFCCVSKQSGVSDKKEYLLKLSPTQVREAFDNVLTEGYIKELAKEFATRAAVQFMKEITNQKNGILSQLKLKRSSHAEHKSPAQLASNAANMVQAARQQPNDETKDENESNKSELDDSEALKLLEDPSPDGDHLDSSGELTDHEKNKIPVIQVTKINGIYYRRLLGMI